jgi:hypothetical protein
LYIIESGYEWKQKMTTLTGVFVTVLIVTAFRVINTFFEEVCFEQLLDGT